MTIETLQTMRAIDGLEALVKRLRECARECQSRPEVGRAWYEKQLRNKGAARAYRHAAELLVELRRELDE